MEQCCTYLDFIIYLVVKLHTVVATVFLLTFFIIIISEYDSNFVLFAELFCLLKEINKN